MQPHRLIAPSQEGLMVGFPPPVERRITPANAHLPQHLGWRILNIERLFPMARVSRGDGSVSALPSGRALDVESLSVEVGDGQRLPMTSVWESTGVDALLVLHRGQVIFERYLGDMSSHRLHPMFSCTKSIIGLLVERLVIEGAVDEDSPASHFIPELAGSVAGAATVRQLLDMRANFRFSDRPRVMGEVQIDYIMGTGFIPRPPDYRGAHGVYELLMGAREAGPHGGAFCYDNGSTDLLGWILRRLTQQSLDQLIGQAIWSRLGAQADAGMLVDLSGTEWAAAGLVCTLRDFARLGEMLLGKGRFRGQQILPESLFDSIFKGGDRAAFAQGQGIPEGGSYRSQWWLYHDRHQLRVCRGQYGQRLWIAPESETVIAQFSVDPSLAALEPLRVRAVHSILEAL